MKFQTIMTLLFGCLLSTTPLLLAQNVGEVKVPDAQKIRLLELELQRARMLLQIDQLREQYTTINIQLEKLATEVEENKKEAFKEAGVKPEEFDLDVERMVFVKKQPAPLVKQPALHQTQPGVHHD